MNRLSISESPVSGKATGVNGASTQGRVMYLHIYRARGCNYEIMLYKHCAHGLLLTRLILGHVEFTNMLR